MTILLKLFVTFFKIGLFTIGGGYAMLPMIQDEVIRNGWVTAGELVDFIAIAESTPGPFAVNMATFVGMGQGGPARAVVSTLGVVLPSFIIILLIARCFACFLQNRTVAGAMEGLRPAAAGLVASAVVTIAVMVIFPAGFSFARLAASVGAAEWKAALIALAVYLLSRNKKIHPAYWLGLSAIAGIFLLEV